MQRSRLQMSSADLEGEPQCDSTYLYESAISDNETSPIEAGRSGQFPIQIVCTVLPSLTLCPPCPSLKPMNRVVAQVFAVPVSPLTSYRDWLACPPSCP